MKVFLLAFLGKLFGGILLDIYKRIVDKFK